MNSLKGLEKPPLADDKFCVHSYHKWMDDNQYWPWQMTFNKYKDWLDARSKPLSDNVFTRLDQQELRLTNLKHWFFSVEQAIKSGKNVSQEVIEDYNKRK